MGLTTTYRRRNRSLGIGSSRQSSPCRSICQICSSRTVSRFQKKKQLIITRIFFLKELIIRTLLVDSESSSVLPETESNKQSWEENVPKSNHVIPIPWIELLWHLQHHGKARPIVTTTSNLNFAVFYLHNTNICFYSLHVIYVKSNSLWSWHFYWIWGVRWTPKICRTEKQRWEAPMQPENGLKIVRCVADKADEKECWLPSLLNHSIACP